MGLVYFAAVTVALLALDRLVGYQGSFGGRPTRPKLSTVAHAAN